MSKESADSEEGEQEPESDIDMPSRPEHPANRPPPTTTTERCIWCGTAFLGPEGSVLIQPCRCGYWIHEKCLISICLNFENANLDTRSIGCRICQRAYNISPAKSLFLKYAVKCSSIWYQAFCNHSMELLIEVVGDVLFVKFGSFVFKQIYGPEEASRLISSMTPLAAIYTCQMVPVVSTIIYNIPWEGDILYLLRKGSNLPMVGRIFPMEDEEVEDIYRDHSGFTYDVAGGLLLPIYAVGVSKLFTTWVEEPLQRFLLVGAAIILTKGVCKMFYKQKKYKRYCTLSVLNSAPSEKSHQLNS